MPETPERDIEKQLRQHADQRRAAAGEPSLHPATRRLLQTEVRRHWGGRGAGHTTESWLQRFWPRLAFVLGVVAVLVTAGVFLFGPGEKTPMHFAKLEESAPPARAIPVAAPAAAPVAAHDFFKEMETASAVSPATDTKVGSGAAFADQTGSFAAAPAASATREFSAADTLAAKTTAPAAKGQFFAGTALAKKEGIEPIGGRTEGYAAAPGALVLETAAVRSQSGALTLADKQTPGVTQYFRNMAIPEGTKAKGTDVLPVLNNFTVAQNGNELTVVDEDGSVYNGTAELAPPAIVSGQTMSAETDRAGGRPAARLAAKDDVARRNVTGNMPAESNTITAGRDVSQATIAGEPLNWQFKVEGTNRSLQQRVVFTGNLIQNTFTPSEERNRQSYQQVPAAQNQLLNYNQGRVGSQNNFINGRVILNERKETELNALSVDPK